MLFTTASWHKGLHMPSRWIIGYIGISGNTTHPESHATLILDLQTSFKYGFAIHTACLTCNQWVSNSIIVSFNNKLSSFQNIPPHSEGAKDCKELKFKNCSLPWCHIDHLKEIITNLLREEVLHLPVAVNKHSSNPRKSLRVKTCVCEDKPNSKLWNIQSSGGTRWNEGSVQPQCTDRRIIKVQATHAVSLTVSMLGNHIEGLPGETTCKLTCSKVQLSTQSQSSEATQFLGQDDIIENL